MPNQVQSMAIDTVTCSASGPSWSVRANCSGRHSNRWRARPSPHPAPCGPAPFFGWQLKHRLAIGLLQILRLLVVLGMDVERIGPQRFLHVALGILGPSLDRRGGQVEGSARFRHSCPALNDLDHQGCLTLRCPTLDAVVYRYTHRYLLLCGMSRFSGGQYIGGARRVYEGPHKRVAASSKPVEIAKVSCEVKSAT
jgi:hypothetical protein